MPCVPQRFANVICAPLFALRLRQLGSAERLRQQEEALRATGQETERLHVAEQAKRVAAEEALDLVSDSCIDWGALSPREVAAAFVLLTGGPPQEAESLRGALHVCQEDGGGRLFASTASVSAHASCRASSERARSEAFSDEVSVRRFAPASSRSCRWAWPSHRRKADRCARSLTEIICAKIQ